jgi:hypothetical protein
MNARRFLIATLLLSAALTPTAAHAQTSDADKGTARDLAIEGYKALQASDYTAAIDRFTRADALYHAPTVILGLARAHVGLGKLVTAQELYNRIAHETLPANASTASKKAVADAQKELDALALRIPGVILDVKVKGAVAAKVTLDGAEVPTAALGVKRPVDPGEHVIRAEAQGLPAREVRVTLGEGKTETVTLLLEPAAPAPAVIPPAPLPIAKPLPVAAARVPVATPLPAVPPPVSSSSSRTPSYLLFGAAGAGVVLGAVFAGMGFSAKSAYDKAPTLDGADKVDRDALIADICFGSALLLGTTGLVTLLLQKKPAPSTATIFLAPRVGTTGAAMAAGFRF